MNMLKWQKKLSKIGSIKLEMGDLARIIPSPPPVDEHTQWAKQIGT